MFTAATKDDTVSNLKNTTPNFRESAHEAQDNMREAANKAGHKVRAFIHSAGDEISHASETVTTQIRTNPVQSSMIVLGVGFVLGALFRR